MSTHRDASPDSRLGSDSEKSQPAVTIVMPVYNEAMYLRETLEGWLRILRGLQVPFEFLVYDDGSTDGSNEILDRCARDCPELSVVHQVNRGHGPTIRRGYESSTGEWVFQTDSDNEIPSEEFDQLWPLREKYDFILGRRVGRKLTFFRRLVSRWARIGVRLFYGARLQDVNSPFRLMRGEFVRSSLQSIPPGVFAPNLHLTGLAARRRLRVREVPVIWRPHRIGGAARAISARFTTLISMFWELRSVSRRAGKG